MSVENTPSTPDRKFYFEPDKWFEVTQVVDRVWAIAEPFQTAEEVRSYYVHGDTQDVLIDTGMGLGDIREVLPLSKNPLVILTHTHWDHVGGAPDFPEVRVPDHPFELERARRGWQPEEMKEMERDNFAEGHKPPDSYSEHTFSIPPIQSIIPLDEGQVLDIGGMTIQAIATPGHTPGGMCFFVPELGYLFTGDTLYPAEEYIHLPESNAEDYKMSLHKLSDITKGKMVTIFPGHNENMSDPQLLYDHIAAMDGTLEPLKIEEGTDVFGPLTRRYYNGFKISTRRE